jgi:signal transduction histidine kinase
MAETVVALAESQGRGDTVAWQELLRRDPSLCWHFFTHHHDLSLERSLFHLKQGIDTASFLEALLEPEQANLADWSRNGALKAYRLSQYVGTLSERIAEQLRLDPLLAHCLGQLTQLGTLVDAVSQKPELNGKHQAHGIYTRQLIRRAPCAPWLRDLILSLDLPSEPDATKWTLLLQLAMGLVTKVGATQSLGQLAAQRLGLSWEAEQEFATQLGQHLPQPPAGLTPESTQLLLRSLRLVQHQPASTLSFAIRQLETEVEDLRSRLARGQQADGDRLREQKLTAVAELAAGAGHEINNPLAVISGQAQYLLKGEEDLNRAKALERIIAQTGRIHVLLRDLMLFARPPELSPKSIAISKMVKTVLGSVGDLALSRGVRLETGNLSAKNQVTCDIQLLSVAIKSLLTNAIEAAPAGGWVRLDASVHQHKLQLQVTDSGPGVPPHLIENIFDPFFSGRNAGRGVGLGLSKVWRIAQIHGGDVRVEQKPGQPTSFVLEVPLRPARSSGQRALKRPA